MDEGFSAALRRNSAARIAAERPRLEIVIYEGHDLVAKGRHDTSDPFVKIRLLDKEQQLLGDKSWYHYLKTKPVKKTLNPVFKRRGAEETGYVFGPQQHFTKDKFTHEMFAQLHYIQFEVWHEDSFFSDSFMGMAQLTVGQSGCDVNYGAKIDRDLPLTARPGSSETVTGTLRVSVWLRSPENMYQEQLESANQSRMRTVSVVAPPVIEPSQVEAETMEWDARFLRQMVLFKAWSGFEEAIAKGGKVFQGTYADPKTEENVNCELVMQAVAEGGIGIAAELRAFGKSIPVTVRIMELPHDPRPQHSAHSGLLKLVVLAPVFSFVGTYSQQEDDIHGNYTFAESEGEVLNGSMEISCRGTVHELKDAENKSAALNEQCRAVISKLVEGATFTGTLELKDQKEDYNIQVPSQEFPPGTESVDVQINAVLSGKSHPVVMHVSGGEGSVNITFQDQDVLFKGTLDPSNLDFSGTTVGKDQNVIGSFKLTKA